MGSARRPHASPWLEAVESLWTRSFSPKTSRNSSEAASATFGCAKKSPSVAMYATSLTTLITLSSEPRWFLAAESTFRAAIRAASRPCSTLYSLPNRPTNFGSCDGRENAAEIKQVARLDTFNISAEWNGRGRQLNAEFRKPALRACRLRALRAHHLPECAPPSTCNTSPVT